MNIVPTRDQIDQWIIKYVPEKDLFFLREEDFLIFEKYLDKVLVIPMDEFFAHASYKQIQLVNSYEYWNISKAIQFIILANSEWFTKLPKEMKKLINIMQFEVDRGLILPLSSLTTLDVIPNENIVVKNEQQYIVLQSEMWRTLPYTLKENLIKEYASKWDSWECYELPMNAPKHLQKYANTFPLESGSNCLSSTLFAISEQEWIIHEWVHPETFLEGLNRASYYLTNEDEEKLQDSDIVVWRNAEGNIQHASYYIGDNLFFNKNGQTFFNPWKVVGWTELSEEWKSYSINFYRKKEIL